MKKKQEEKNKNATVQIATHLNSKYVKVHAVLAELKRRHPPGRMVWMFKPVAV